MHFKNGRMYLSDYIFDHWECTLPSVTYWILWGMYRSKFETSSWYKFDAKRLLGE